MAGHSKFKNIQHRKGAQDKKRAKVFSRLSKEITVAVKMGSSPDPEMNPRLRTAISAARGANMPNDRIKRAIQAGADNSGGADWEEIRYEGYGPGGVALIVEALTDNRNRAAAEIRTTFAKNGGSMGETGSVSFNFSHIGQIIYANDVADEEAIFEAALEAGAENVESDGETHEITTEMTDYASVQDELAKVYGDPMEAGIIWKPNLTVEPNEDQATTLLKLIDKLDDLDDVQSVYANFDIAEDVLERISA